MQEFLWSLSWYVFRPITKRLTPEAYLRFAEVDPRKLYRCAQPSPSELERLVQKYRIQSLVIARNTIEPSELEVMERLGLNLHHMQLGRNLPTDSQIREYLEFVNAPRHQPILIHCQHGRDRTGLAVLLYRVEVQGWSTQNAWREMKRFGHAWWFFSPSYYQDWLENRYHATL